MHLPENFSAKIPVAQNTTYPANFLTSSKREEKPVYLKAGTKF